MWRKLQPHTLRSVLYSHVPVCPAACSVVAKDELDNLLVHHQLGKRVPILFLANKMDLPTALAPVELAQVRK